MYTEAAREQERRHHRSRPRNCIPYRWPPHHTAQWIRPNSLYHTKPGPPILHTVTYRTRPTSLIGNGIIHLIHQSGRTASTTLSDQHQYNQHQLDQLDGTNIPALPPHQYTGTNPTPQDRTNTVSPCRPRPSATAIRARAAPFEPRSEG